jgi:LysM repeat protein
MTAVLRLLRGLGALAVLVGVVVGTPALLVALHLVPTAVPSIHEIGAVLSARDDGQLLRAVLAAGVWVCWLIFTLVTGAEIWARIRSHPAPRVPGLGGVQGPVAALLAMVVVGLSLSSAAAPLAAVESADRPPLPVAAMSVALAEPSHRQAALVVAGAEPSAGPEYVVQRRDTLWALAERHLGDPLRYTEIVALNQGRIGPDNQITPGTALTFPTDATGLTASPSVQRLGESSSAVDVVVEPGDSLWSIAEDLHGDGETWPTVWAANAGRTEAGGEVFDDPDLIRPGWTLTVLAIPGVGPAEPGGTGSTPTPGPPPASPTATPTASPTTPPSATPSPTSSPSLTPTAVPTTSTSGAQPTASAGPDSRATAPRPDDGTETTSDGSVALAAAAAASSVLGAVSLLALRRYRRRQFRHRQPGRAVPVPPPELASAERVLMGAEGVDVTFLDRAMRSLARPGLKPAATPDVLAVCMSADTVSVRLAYPAHNAPAPWAVDAQGVRWTLGRDSALAGSHGPAPYPGLVSIGRSRLGEHWLLDLERVGVLRVAGHPGRAADLLRYIAAELAHNSWSEMLEADAVDLGAELATLNPDRLRMHGTSRDAIDRFERSAQERSAAIAAGSAGALQARVDDLLPDAWAPRVLLLGHGSDATGHLEEALLGVGQRMGLAVVMATDADGPGMQMTIDRDGVISVPELDLQLEAHQLPVGEAAALAQLLAHAAALPGDVGTPSASTQDASGGGHLQAHEEAEATGNDRPQVVDGLVESVLPLPDDTYSVAAATTARDVLVLAPATTPARREDAAAADPHLDEDLADWDDPDCRRPKLTLLGPVRVDAQGKLPERNPRRQFYTEVVAYLATRPDGATSEQYATALWPDEPDVIGKTKVRQSISVVRSWLGAGENGEDYLPSGLTTAAGGRYRITGALVDSDLFRRLRTRALARGADGIADLHAALGLVRGRPLELPDLRVRGVGGYGWLLDDGGDRMDLEFAAMVVDVAHLVATYHLGNGEPDRAVSAAKVALQSETFEDVPLLDLVAACDALGNRAEADAYVQRILANHDAEVEEDLPPRTAAILHRRARA